MFHQKKAALYLLLALCSVLAVAASPRADTRLSDVVFVAFDTETTGFGAQRNRVLELAAVKWRNGERLEHKQWLINPEMEIHPMARNVHGITSEMIKDKPLIADILPLFRAFSAHGILLAHNARFDVDFLAAELKRSEQEPLGVTVIDTLALFRAWFPEAPEHSLEGLVKYLRLPAGQHHRALQDADYILLILEKALQQLDDPTMTLKDMMDAAGGGRDL